MVSVLVAVVAFWAGAAGTPGAMAFGLASAWLLAAFCAAALAEERDRSPSGFFMFGLAAPYIAIVVALLMDGRPQARARETLQDIAAAVKTSPRPQSVADEISKLADLHSTGALTDAEFAELKRRALAD